MDGKGMELSDGLLTYLDWDWYVVDCFKEIRMIGYAVKTDDEDHPYSIIEFPHLVLDANEIRNRGHDYCREQQAKTTRWTTGYCDKAQVLKFLSRVASSPELSMGDVDYCTSFGMYRSRPMEGTDAEMLMQQGIRQQLGQEGSPYTGP